MNTLTLTKEANISAVLAAKESMLVKVGNKIVGRFIPSNQDDDAYWGEAALQASDEGYLSKEETISLFERIRNARN